MKIGENKVTSVVVCAFLMITAIGGVSIFTNFDVFQAAEAIDVGSKPIVGLAPVGSVLDTDQADLSDIAWNSAGTIALAVGWSTADSRGVAYRFEARTGEWFRLTHEDGNMIYGVTWCDTTEGGSFIVVADGTSGTDSSVGYTDGFNGLMPLYGGLNGENLRSVATNNIDPNPVVVGLNGAFMYDGTDWQPIGGLQGGDTYNDITYTGGFYYIVGERFIDPDYRGVFYRLVDGGQNAQYISPPEYYDPAELNVFMFDLHGVDAIGDDVILVGTNIIDVYNEGSYMGTPVHLEDPMEYIFRGVVWSNDIVAYIVGHDLSNNGFYYQYNIELHKVSEIPGSSDISNAQHGIAGTNSSPMMISVGNYASDSAWQISQTSSFNNVITDVETPDIQWMRLYDFEDSGKTQRLNSQIDVNPEGQIGRRYVIEVEVTHKIQGYLDSVEVYGWFDEGFTGQNSNFPEVGPDLRTRAFYFEATYDGEQTNFHQWFPDEIIGDPIIHPEIRLLDWESSATYGWDEVNEQDIWTIEFVFAPGAQTRFAPGDNGQFHGPLGGDHDKDSALNTPNTWDFHIRGNDVGEGEDNMWGEFGIFRFTSLTLSGLPGSYHGVGAPGQEIELTAGETVLRYSANCEHLLHVYVETDLKGTLGQNIPASSLEVQGGFRERVAITAAGYGNSVYLLGDSTPSYIPPRNMYDHSLTSIDTSNEEPTSYQDIRWWITIPSVPEDTYSANIVYVLEHSG